MKKSETHSSPKRMQRTSNIPLGNLWHSISHDNSHGDSYRYGKESRLFCIGQMFCPAAGLLVAKLLCDKDKRCMPKNFFIGYLVLTGITLLWCFTTFFLPFQQVSTGGMVLSIITALVFISVYLSESNDARSAYGLKSKNWKLSVCLLILFCSLALCFPSAGDPFDGDRKCDGRVTNLLLTVVSTSYIISVFV